MKFKEFVGLLFLFLEGVFCGILIFNFFVGNLSSATFFILMAIYMRLIQKKKNEVA